MGIQMFLVFIGSLLGCSVLLAVGVKNLAEGVAISGKKPYLYGSATAILTSLAAFLASFMSTNPFNTFWIFGGIFCLFGIIHLTLMHNRFFYAHKRNSNKVLIAEILFAFSVIFFTLVVFSALQYFFKDKHFLFYPIVMSSLLFLVPLLVFHSFQAAYEIPAAIFPTWQYPRNRSADPPEIEGGDRVLIIGFEIAQRASDNRRVYFRVRAPETWQLSNLFFHFLNEYNDPENKTSIEYYDRNDEPYEWWFYTKAKWYQKPEILNPEFSIRESGIRENTVIVCERHIDSEAVLKQFNKSYER
jgi:hypothetical protein